MTDATPILAFSVTSESPMTLRAVESLARERISPDRAEAEIGRWFPNGIEETTTRNYRVGDYFDDIELIHDGGEQAFRIVFHVRDGVDRFWQDAMVAVLLALRNAGAQVESVRPGDADGGIGIAKPARRADNCPVEPNVVCFVI